MRDPIRIDYASAFHRPCAAMPTDRGVARALLGGIAGIVLGASLLGGVGLGLMLGLDTASHETAAARRTAPAALSRNPLP